MKTRSSLRDVVTGTLSQDADGAVEAHQTRYAAPDGVNAATGAARFYDLVTDFYEYGWGQSFHFAPRFSGEALAASIARLEHTIALKLQLRPGMRVLDAGCGVGGPMRAIARFSGAEVEGVTINAYQVQRANKLNRSWHLDDRCLAIQGDFHDLPYPDDSFDAAYSFEAICHAADRAAVFAELVRVVKPGGRIAGTDWCLTERFEPGNEQHDQIRTDIEVGNGLEPLISTTAFGLAMLAAGLTDVQTRDLAPGGPGDVPWYQPLQAGIGSPAEFRRTRFGRALTHRMVQILEALRLAPSGTVATSEILNRAADGLVAGGVRRIFTPLFQFSGQVPRDAP